MTQRKRKFFVQWNLLTQGKVKRFYAFKIPDYSSKSLRTIFDKHIDKTAYITTDEWKGYRPIKDYNITQKPSNDGKNFPTLHKVIHQVKSWIRGIYSWVSEFNIDRFYIFILKFDRKTFCFIKNRFYKSSSLSRTNVFGLIPLFIIYNS